MVSDVSDTKLTLSQIKTASLRWHSPMLNDISAVSFYFILPLVLCLYISQVKTWDKVNSGMIKMYIAEVLDKLPVMQHFLFGSILSYDGPASGKPNEDLDDAHRGHAHAHEGLGGAGQHEVGWGDCCGIPVPSAFAAAQAKMEKQPGLRLVGPGIKPVPFD
jgi:serine/threonine-protein phosphatase 2A activator